MPKSRVRKKKPDLYVRPAATASAKKKQPSPAWFGALIGICFLVGIAWLVVYYLSGAEYPVRSLEAWNVVVGFLWIAFGFGLATQWR
ncbi:MAG TPA: cell division protein CrgA [Mycobacteriales bacterium]|jgi:hypothetical protein